MISQWGRLFRRTPSAKLEVLLGESSLFSCHFFIELYQESGARYPIRLWSKQLFIHHGLIGRFVGLLTCKHRLMVVMVCTRLVIVTWIERRHLQRSH